MARRKRHHKTTHRHHRRRVGALHTAGLKEALITTIGVAGGIIGGRLINNMINPSPAPGATIATSPAISPTLLGAGEAAVGGFVATKMRNPKYALLKGAVMGFAGNGLMYALSSKGLNILPAAVGYGPDPFMRPPRAVMTGFRDVPKIGFPRPSVIGAPRDRARMMRQYAGVYGC